jgi:hypothetical protein
MLKSIALAGVFFFASAISTAAVSQASAKTARPTPSAPTAPQPKGWCFPAGMPC